MSKLPGFGGGAYTLQSVDADAQTCVNLYPEADESGQGKGSPVLVLKPGLSLFATLPSGPVRGLWVGENRLFAAGGSTLYEVSAGGGVTSRGNIGSDGRMVQMFPNGDQLGVISAGAFWLDNGSSVVQPNFRPPNASQLVTAMQGTYLDSYFVVIDQPSGADSASVRRFRWSTPLDGTQWDLLQAAAKEGYPDELIGMLSDHEDLWLFGSQTTEVWRSNYSAKPEDAPWERDPGAFIHYGLAAEFAANRIGQGIIWLSGDPRGHARAFYAQGYQPTRVSTHAIEEEWATYGTRADAESFAYSDNGHDFWQLTFPSANRTWVYDLTTKLWHRRGYWNGSSLDRDRARCHGYCFGKHLVGDYANGNIYVMSQQTYTDNGTPIHWERAVPHVTGEEKRIFHSRMELAMEKGTGATVTLDWSNDGGHSWNTARNATTGSSGLYRTRVVWRRLGHARDRVYRFSGTTSSKTVLVDAFIEAQAGSN